MRLVGLYVVFMFGLNSLFAKRSCHQELTALDNCLSSKDDQIAISKPRIAFSVTRSTDVNLRPLQTLVFDKVYLNEGNGYNPHNGVFTAPAAGMYYFSVSFLAKSGNTHLLLMKNNYEVGKGFGSAPDETGSIIATVNLKKGDVIRVAEITGKGTESIIGQRFSSFTGFML